MKSEHKNRHVKVEITRASNGWIVYVVGLNDFSSEQSVFKTRDEALSCALEYLRGHLTKEEAV